MKLNTIEHPKTAALARELDAPLLLAVGVLESLWHFTSRYARRGDVGRFTNAEIAAGIHWHMPDPTRLIASLIKTGWLDEAPDGRLRVHDWEEHAENWVKGLVARTESGTKSGTKSEPAPPPSSGTKVPTPCLSSPSLPMPIQQQQQQPAAKIAAAGSLREGNQELREALALARIDEPTLTELAGLPNLTPAIVRHERDRMASNGKGTGALVQRLRGLSARPRKVHP